MKKVTVILLLFFLLSAVTGCQKTIEPSPIKKEFTAAVKCDGEVYTVTCNGTGVMNMIYDLPEALQGLTYSYQGNNLTIKYGTLHYTPSNSLPENTLSQLHDILTNINENTEKNIKCCNEQETVYMMSDSEITCSTNDGTIRNIFVKSTEKKYVFSDCQ